MSDNNINDCGTGSDGESTEEEIEPKLKYKRILYDLKEVLKNETASCIAVHPKFICLGTSWGVVHIFDHKGYLTEFKLKKHTVAVNMISIDYRGEYVASCSGDGDIHVNGLYGEPDASFTVHAGRHVRCVALEPSNGGASNKRAQMKLITGDDRLILHERVYSMLGLARVKSTVLCESEGYVGAVAWEGQFVAWSSSVGVRVYDLKARRSLGLIRWERPAGGIKDEDGITQSIHSLDDFRCNLRWADERTVLIGWADTVRICIIRRRGATPASVVTNAKVPGDLDEAPEHQVDPISTFRTNFYISGIAPLDHQLILLGVPSRGSPGTRPQLHVVEYRDCEHSEVCSDTLSLRGYANYTCSDYHLDVLNEENRFFVIAPKDVVVASPCDLDDRVHWLVQHSKFEQALEAVENVRQKQHHVQGDTSSAPEKQRHTKLSVGGAYLDHLLSIEEYEQAGRLCLRLFGRNAELWHSHVYKFARARRLRSISKFLPRNLEPHIYEMVLYEYLKTDSNGFLALVCEWHQANLYNRAAVVNAVLEHLLVCDVDNDKPTLMEALAVLYGHEGCYDKALSMYLKLGHTAVFDMIRENCLYGSIHGMIVDLMQLDVNKTVELLLHDRKRIPPDVVVEKLSGLYDQYLYRYLDALDKEDTRECGQYHGLMVRLYSVFARDKLLPFLKRSDQYPIQEALDVCQRQRYYLETVFLLGRMGDTKVALNLIIEKLDDVSYAIAFCQEHDDAELWTDLVEYSAKRPNFITYLLPRVAGHVDPTELINRIEAGFEIQGLRDGLIRMLRQINLQASIQEGCQKILVTDYYALYERLVRSRQRGLLVSDEILCGACHRKLTSDLVVYNCRHTFHETCLSRPVRETCAICSTSSSATAQQQIEP